MTDPTPMTETPPQAKPAPVKDAPAFDFYPERWLAGVAEMSDGDQIAYLRLLCHQWLRDGLPVEVAALSRLAGRKVSEAVLAKFPLADNDGRRRNKRLEVLRKEQRARIANASARGRKMAEGRWGKKEAPAMHEHSSSIPPALLDDCPPLTTHHPPRAEDKSSALSAAAAAEGGLAGPPEGEVSSPPGGQTKPPANPRQRAFIRRWCELFPQHHPTAYHFQGGRDATSLKRFLASSRLTVAELMQIAVRCWSSAREAYAPGWLHGAASIHGFCTDFNRLAGYRSPAEAKAKANANAAARHAAYTVANATSGMSGQEIGDF